MMLNKILPLYGPQVFSLYKMQTLAVEERKDITNGFQTF